MSFEKTEYFCLKCGSKSVWKDEGSEDYYAGCPLICTACSYYWYLPSEPSPASAIFDRCLTLIKEGIA